MNVLYLLSNANIFGGTPKKTLDLIKAGNFNSSVYFWSNDYNKFHAKFEKSGASIYVGNYGRNFIKHIRHLLHIIDSHKIDIVQTQFSRGEVFGALIKMFRPHVKVIVAFVVPFEPIPFKSKILGFMYKYIDAFVFVSKYVRENKIEQFPSIEQKVNKVIYNGTYPREDSGEEATVMKHISIFDIAGLSEWKNIQVLIKAFNIIVNEQNNDKVFLYIAGDGPKKEELYKLIKKYALEEHIHLLGYQDNVGRLLQECDIFVHPSYAEGFGIAVAEAMRANKPIIVSDEGALPELIKDELSGLVVNPHNAEDWAKAIKRLINDKKFAQILAENAKKEAEKRFSVEKYRSNYEHLYKQLV